KQASLLLVFMVASTATFGLDALKATPEAVLFGSVISSVLPRYDADRCQRPSDGPTDDVAKSTHSPRNSPSTLRTHFSRVAAPAGDMPYCASQSARGTRGNSRRMPRMSIERLGSKISLLSHQGEPYVVTTAKRSMLSRIGRVRPRSSLNTTPGSQTRSI